MILKYTCFSILYNPLKKSVEMFQRIFTNILSEGLFPPVKIKSDPLHSVRMFD